MLSNFRSPHYLHLMPHFHLIITDYNNTVLNLFVFPITLQSIWNRSTISSESLAPISAFQTITTTKVVQPVDVKFSMDVEIMESFTYLGVLRDINSYHHLNNESLQKFVNSIEKESKKNLPY